MDEATREMIGCTFIAVCDAAGLGVLETANKTIMAAVENGGVSDPVARQALTVLVQACQPDDTASDVKDALVDVAEATAAKLGDSVGALAAAIGDDSITRITAHIARRIGRINATTPREEIVAILAMTDALDAALDRIKVDAGQKVDA
jgi:hypothetical protein